MTEAGRQNGSRSSTKSKAQVYKSSSQYSAKYYGSFCPKTSLRSENLGKFASGEIIQKSKKI